MPSSRIVWLAYNFKQIIIDEAKRAAAEEALISELNTPQDGGLLEEADLLEKIYRTTWANENHENYDYSRDSEISDFATQCEREHGTDSYLPSRGTPSQVSTDNVGSFLLRPIIYNGEELLTDALRTLVFSNLADPVTERELLNVVRGGALLDIYWYDHGHAAKVSFIQASAAEAFLAYTKRHDIYLRGKRVGDQIGS